MAYRLTALVFLFLSAHVVTPVAGAQETTFSLDAYRAFLQSNADLSAGDLIEQQAAGDFAREARGASLETALYADSIDLKYALTPYERSLVDRHGFMVTERIDATSFGDAYKEIYTSDLPVFISTDAILHAIHMSYDDILMQTEQQVLIPKLDELLTRLHADLPALAGDFEGEEHLYAPLSDVDVYLTTARRLLSGSEPPPVFERSLPDVEDMLSLVESESATAYPLFAENCRTLDFSQFTPRGHYTREPDLERYFQAMIWLGRTELYLTKPDQPGGAACEPSDADVARQVRMSVLLAELATRAEIMSLYEEIDALIEMFVGESDNVTYPQLFQVMEEAGISSAASLDSAAVAHFQDVLAVKPFSGQRILSQILFSDPMHPDQIEPASAFMLLGQRFVIDSYVTAEVVFDRVKREDAPVRLLPSTLDVLFALGNDAAGQLLENELETFKYAPNLAALRYLIDSYDSAYWERSMYTGWLHAIRTLRAPADRSSLPPFMQTAAWWQEKMNTQLAAWAQLRHDNLLYVKQSYTGSIGCEFPFSYVEPIPEFYEAVSRFAVRSASRFRELSGGEGWSTSRIASYFENLAAVNDTLGGIAAKELAGEHLTDDESHFLERMLRIMRGCGEQLDGWYTSLYYNPQRATKEDLVVADIHTTPTDEGGNMVGWVVHAGTGPLDMAVLTAEVPGAGPVAFVGPVMSYYEHVSTGFERLTDEEWQTAYAEEPSFRPEFVNLYLADANGEAREASTLNLVMTSSEAPPEAPSDGNLRLAPNYPNPFRERTVIGFRVPSSRAHEAVEVAVYNVQGQRVRTLLSRPLPGGAYTVEWDGQLDGGMKAASGTYLCRLSVGGAQASRVITLLR